MRARNFRQIHANCPFPIRIDLVKITFAPRIGIALVSIWSVTGWNAWRSEAPKYRQVHFKFADHSASARAVEKQRRQATASPFLLPLDRFPAASGRAFEWSRREPVHREFRPIEAPIHAGR